jgi:hypothetical protein
MLLWLVLLDFASGCFSRGFHATTYNSVISVTRLETGRPRNRDSTSGDGRDFIVTATSRLTLRPSHQSNGYEREEAFSLWWSCRDVNHLLSFSAKIKETGRGRAIAQAVSSRLPTAAARVRAQVSSCGIVVVENYAFPWQSRPCFSIQMYLLAVW